MTSLFNDNENIACESCGKVIMHEMSFFDWEQYCDVVEKRYLMIYLACVTLVLFVSYSGTIMESIKR